MTRTATWAFGGPIALFLIIQMIPYGGGGANPPARREPAWDRPATRELARRACFDCHSNETSWPWYTRVAPASWLARWDVDEGRRELNFSEWDRPQKEARETAETVRKGEMPPWYYTLIRPGARLSAAETQALIQGLEATFGGRPGNEGKRFKKDEGHEGDRSHRD